MFALFLLITCHSRCYELPLPCVEYTCAWVQRRRTLNTESHKNAFWNLLLFGMRHCCSEVFVDGRCHRFREALYLHLTGKRVKIGAPRYYETLVGQYLSACQSARHYIVEDSNLHSHWRENLRSHKINLSDGSQTWKMFCLTVKIYSDGPVLVQSLWASLHWALCLTDCIMKFSQIFLHYIALCVYFHIMIHACSSFPFPIWKSELSSMWFNVNVNFVAPGTGIWGFRDSDVS